MAIREILKIPYGDKQHKVLVTMDLIDEIEGDTVGINLMKMAASIGQDNLRYSQAAKLLSVLLQSVGCYATQEDVWDCFTEDGNALEAMNAVPILYKFFDVVFNASKKNDTEVKSKSLKRTRGKTSTK
jgi:hypothetical protein